ncbi:hypothetical protein J7T55_005724 [Diaporthe amygdali]|uniref:uncharacterized protein n=1 Tax=Phomopsis amygdali TaxID=1214568 RepID=UPI0022FE352A|nr:uncharacterized protein J7T55_005724 [Diaporthe amygdali]KAJ0124386.1 hypothetical protein J7T55_005724 [Diaporthe amygdali]
MSDNGVPNHNGESIEGFVHFCEGYLLALSEREREDNGAVPRDVDQDLGVEIQHDVSIQEPFNINQHVSEAVISPEMNVDVGFFPGHELPLMVQPNGNAFQQPAFGQDAPQANSTAGDEFGPVDMGFQGLDDFVRFANLPVGNPIVEHDPAVDEPCHLALADEDIGCDEGIRAEWEAAVQRRQQDQRVHEPRAAQFQQIPCGRKGCNICSAFSLPF